MGWGRGVRDYVRSHIICQRIKRKPLKNDKIAPKVAEVKYWDTLCIDTIYPYKTRRKDKEIQFKIIHNHISCNRLV